MAPKDFFKMKRVAANKRNARGKDKQPRREHVKDATVVSKLSPAQLTHLIGELKKQPFTMNDHGLEDPEYTCHEYGNKKGKVQRTAAVFLGHSASQGANDFRAFHEDGRYFTAHQVVMAFNGNTTDDPKATASHLCDNAWCCRPEHLVWESQRDNESRKFCPGWVVCQCCDEFTDACQHNPRCILGQKMANKIK